MSVKVNKKQDLQKFILYPNPTSGEFSLKLSKDLNEGSITIYSTLGKKVLEKKIDPQSSIYKFNLVSGIYFVTVNNSNSVFTKKLIVE